MSLIIIAAVWFGLPFASWADDAGQAPGPGTAAPAPDTSSALLKGGVKGAAILTKDGLIKVGESTRAIEQSSERLMGEVTRKDTIQLRGPNALPNGVIIPAMPNPSGMIQMGNLPARPKWINNFMNEISYQLELLQNEVDALIVPEQNAGALAEQWQQIRQIIANTQEHFLALKELTVGPKYDNDKISREALYIHDGASAVNKIRREILKTLKSS